MTAPAMRSRAFGVWYVLEHQLREIKHYGPATFAQAIGTPLLSWLAYGIGIGALVTAGTGGAGIDGVPYLAFVLPAMMCALTLQIWAEESMFGPMVGLNWRRTFVAMRSTPLVVSQIAGGVELAVLLRAALTAVLYAVVSLVAGAFSSPLAPLSVLAALLGAAAFGLPLAAYSASLRSESGQFALVNRFLVLPLTLLSGTMFPLAAMPIWLQWIGWLSPLWHAAELARSAANGTSEPAWLLVVHVLYLLALAVLGWALLVRALRRRLEQ